MRSGRKEVFGHGLREVSKEVINSRKALMLLALMIIAISVVTLWNTTEMQSAIDRRTEAYVADVCLQLANDIDNRLAKNIMDLE